MALYYGKKQISGGRDYKTEHQMEDYSVSFVDDGEGYTDAAAALSEINSGSKFGKLFAAIKGCLMKFLSSISSLSSDLTALQNKATELQNTITELENKATELQEKTTTLENGLTSCNSDYENHQKMFDLGRVLAWCHGTGTATTTTYTIAKGNNITSVTRTSETSGAYTVTLQNMPHANYAAFVSAEVGGAGQEIIGVYGQTATKFTFDTTNHNGAATYISAFNILVIG